MRISIPLVLVTLAGLLVSSSAFAQQGRQGGNNGGGSNFNLGGQTGFGQTGFGQTGLGQTGFGGGTGNTGMGSGQFSQSGANFGMNGPNTGFGSNGSGVNRSNFGAYTNPSFGNFTPFATNQTFTTMSSNGFFGTMSNNAQGMGQQGMMGQNGRNGGAGLPLMAGLNAGRSQGQNQNNRGGMQNQNQTQQQLRFPTALGFTISGPPPAVRAQRFETRLTKIPGLTSKNVAVRMDGRTAILVGTVADAHERALIQQLAKLEPGVSAVNIEGLVIAASAPPVAAADSTNN